MQHRDMYVRVGCCCMRLIIFKQSRLATM